MIGNCAIQQGNEGVTYSTMATIIYNDTYLNSNMTLLEPSFSPASFNYYPNL